MVGCRTFNMKDYPEDRYCEWEEIEFKEEFVGSFAYKELFLIKGS